MLNKIRKLRQQLDEGRRRLSLLLDADIPDFAAVATARWDLATQIMQFMMLVERHVFANLAADPRPHIAALALRYRADYARYYAEGRAHTNRWPASQVMEDWPSYRIEAHDQLRLMDERLVQLERELLPRFATIAIDSAGPISLNWAREAFEVKATIISGRSAQLGEA